VDLLVLDPVTGAPTGLDATVRRTGGDEAAAGAAATGTAAAAEALTWAR
jgi:hypothetical protein